MHLSLNQNTNVTSICSNIQLNAYTKNHKYWKILQCIPLPFSSTISVPYLAYLKYWDRQACANCEDQVLTPQDAASDQGLHRLPHIKQFLSTSVYSKIDLFKLWVKYGKKVSYVFVCVEVLRPSQSNGAMTNAVSLPKHTFAGKA